MFQPTVRSFGTAILPLICAFAGAQTNPQFEVATVKQVINTREGDRPDRSKTDVSFLGKAGNPFRISGSRVMVQGTALSLIMAAYEVKPYQIINAPAWADSLIYSVTAKSDGDAAPTVQRIRLMMQSLLADRFGLQLHPGTKDMNVYHLTRGKKNIGLRPAGADEAFDWKLNRNPDGTLRSTGIHETIGDFVQLVGVSADRPVIDKTGVTGFIDYDIIISPPDTRNQDDVNRAILDAVRDQLGLKLEPVREAVDVFIVDRIDRPSEN